MQKNLERQGEAPGFSEGRVQQLEREREHRDQTQHEEQELSLPNLYRGQTKAAKVWRPPPLFLSSMARTNFHCFPIETNTCGQITCKFRAGRRLNSEIWAAAPKGAPVESSSIALVKTLDPSW